MVQYTQPTPNSHLQTTSIQATNHQYPQPNLEPTQTNKTLSNSIQIPQGTPPTTSALSLSLLTSLGGIIGYTRTGSIPSIAAGLSVGFIYLLSFLRLRAGQPYGVELGLLASAVLGGSSIPRVIKTGGKPVPVGLSLLAAYGVWVFGVAFRGKSL
ncbi:hypothetical protein N7535_005768 [Penicillium sp. DV-2018c]|nr:hypothetical protein N7461_009343 [Penicillium sp. DV-2018c]KAJ5572108.1 hypothetical protein N7535_005768 [Penicillium sp. DV-2018c]